MQNLLLPMLTFEILSSIKVNFAGAGQAQLDFRSSILLYKLVFFRVLISFWHIAKPNWPTEKSRLTKSLKNSKFC